jgi:hypothetical protein
VGAIGQAVHVEGESRPGKLLAVPLWDEEFLMRMMLNSAEQPSTDLPANWGDLLQRLDRDANRRGEVVTAVRFDGVDEPTFRQPSQSARALHDLSVIELETATPASLLDDALMQAGLAAGVFAASAGQIGSAFRRRDLSNANERLTELGEGIRGLVWIVGTAAATRGVSLDPVAGADSAISMQLAALTGQLVSIVEAQQAQDFLTVADLLEYDLQPTLYSWQVLFEALRHMPAKNAAQS